MSDWKIIKSEKDLPPEAENVIVMGDIKGRFIEVKARVLKGWKDFQWYTETDRIVQNVTRWRTGAL